MPQTLLLARSGILELKPRHNGSRKNLDETQAADIRVGQRLEHKARRIALFRHEHFAAIGGKNGAMGRGVREIRADVFHEALNSLLDDGRPNENGNEELLGDGFVEQAFELVLRELLFAVEVLHHKLVVGLGDKVAQLVARHLRLVEVFVGNIFHALGVAFEIARFHTQHIDNALEIFVNTDGDGHNPQTRAEAGMQCRHDHIEIRMLAIDVVNENRPRQTHGFGLAPQFRRHDLWTLDGIDDEHGHFGSMHSGKRVADEVGVTRGIEQVDLVIFIRNGRNRCAHGEFALDFLGIVVEVRFSVVRRAHARRLAGNIKHGLGQ